MADEAKIDAIKFVRKLRSLADSNTNVNESAIARTRAAEVMKAHHLTEDDISETSSAMVNEFVAPGDFTESWRFALLTQVGYSCNCRVIRVERKEVKDELVTFFWTGLIIGMEADAKSHISLFTYYESQVRVALEVSGYQMMAKSDEDSFIRGVVYALQKRLDEQQRRLGIKRDLPSDMAVKRANEQKAIVRTDVKAREAATFIERKYTNRETSTLGKGTNYSVFLEGQAAAAKIRLMKRVPKKKADEPVSSEVEVDTGTVGPGEEARPAPSSTSP